MWPGFIKIKAMLSITDMAKIDRVQTADIGKAYKIKDFVIWQRHRWKQKEKFLLYLQEMDLIIENRRFIMLQDQSS